MARTKKHTYKGKFNNGIINFNDAHLSFKLYCKRKNNKVGHFRNIKKSKLIKSIINES